MKLIRISRGGIRINEWNLKVLIKQGLYVGQRVSRWNPDVSGFLIGSYRAKHIVNLELMRIRLKKILNVYKNIIKNKGSIVIGNNNTITNKTLKYLIKKSKQPFINAPYKEGGFTHKRKHLELKNKAINHKLKLRLSTKKLIKQTRFLLGGKNKRDSLRDAIIVFNMRKGNTLIKETKKLGILTMGLLTTNLRPDVVNYGVVINGEVLKNRIFLLVLIFHAIFDAVIEAPNKFLKVKSEMMKIQTINLCKEVVSKK